LAITNFNGVAARPLTVMIGAPPMNCDTRSTSSVAEVTMSFNSGRRGNNRLRTPSSKSTLSVRSCASSTMMVS